MANRTPPAEWAALFNFLGAGVVHMELYDAILMSTDNPTLFEAIASSLIRFGTLAARPAATAVPGNCLYFTTDTTVLYQSQTGAWVIVANMGAGGGSGTLGGAWVYRSTNQTIPSSTATPISWSAETYDTLGMWSLSPDPTIITIPATGLYLFQLSLVWDSNTSQPVVSVKNQIPTELITDRAPDAVNVFSQRVNALLEATAGDELTTYVFQASGGDRDLIQNGNIGIALTVERLR